jgi:hypothetical protein
MKQHRTPTRTTSAEKTAAPVAPGDCDAILPEFGRIPDVTRLTGLRRGFLYGLINEGKIKSVCLRKRGAKTGVRLIHLQSVRDFLNANLESSVRAREA